MNQRTMFDIITQERWALGGITEDEGWKILTFDKILHSEDDGDAQAWVATVYDENIARWMIRENNKTIARGEEEFIAT